MEGVDEGGRTDADGKSVNEELVVWERDSDFDELGSTGARVDDEVATPQELVGVADTDTVVRMVIVKGPDNVKPPPSLPAS